MYKEKSIPPRSGTGRVKVKRKKETNVGPDEFYDIPTKRELSFTVPCGVSTNKNDWETAEAMYSLAYDRRRGEKIIIPQKLLLTYEMQDELAKWYPDEFAMFPLAIASEMLGYMNRNPDWEEESGQYATISAIYDFIQEAKEKKGD